MTISGTTSDLPEFEQLVAACGARLRAKVREARLRARVAAEATAEAEAFSGLRETQDDMSGFA